MKILHLHTKMVSGGIEAIVCGLVNEMSKTDDVTLCTIFKPSENDVFYEKLIPNVKKYTIGKINYGFSIKEIFKIYNYIKKGKYDIVHIHGCFQYYFLAILLLHRKTCFIYTIHSDARMENQTWDWRLFKLKRFMFAHRWIKPVAISETSQQTFTDLYKCKSKLIYNGASKPKLLNIPNIIDNLRYTSDTKVFVHAGRISKPKNQIVLCRVFDRLLKQGKDVVLAIVGTAEEKDIFENMKPFFSERIVYLGERNDVPELFARADAFCLPSIWEGMPVTLLEALSVGCISICSPVGGIVNVIKSGVNGLLSLDSTEDEYYKTLCDFIDMPKEKKKEMKKSAIRTFKKFEMKNCSDLYIQFYKQNLCNL